MILGASSGFGEATSRALAVQGADCEDVLTQLGIPGQLMLALQRGEPALAARAYFEAARASTTVHVEEAQGAETQVHSGPKPGAVRSALALKAGHWREELGLRLSVHSTD